MLFVLYVAQYASHIKREACVDSNEVLALEVVQAKAALAVIVRFTLFAFAKFTIRE